jgi:hypothetical protein
MVVLGEQVVQQSVTLVAQVNIVLLIFVVEEEFRSPEKLKLS